MFSVIPILTIDETNKTGFYPLKIRVTIRVGISLTVDIVISNKCTRRT
jgi:hypothetical protein